MKLLNDEDHQHVEGVMINFYKKLSGLSYELSDFPLLELAIIRDDKDQVASIFLQDYKSLHGMFRSYTDLYKTKDESQRLHLSTILLHTAYYIDNCLKLRKQKAVDSRKQFRKNFKCCHKSVDRICKRIVRMNLGGEYKLF